MARKLNMVSAMALAMALVAGPAIAKDIKIKHKVAGALIFGVKMVNPSTGEARTAGLLHLRALGKPGPAISIALAQTTNPRVGACTAPVGTGLLLDFDFDDVVMTFDDLSQIYLALDAGTFCLDLATGSGEGEIDFFIVGGAGKYKDATGNVSLKTTSTALSGSLSSVVNAKSTGIIHTPEDDDDD